MFLYYPVHYNMPSDWVVPRVKVTPNVTSELSSGDYAAECVVKLVDDRLYEEDEQFRLVLGSPESPDLASALVGRQNVTMVTIQDQGDGEELHVH